MDHMLGHVGNYILPRGLVILALQGSTGHVCLFATGRNGRARFLESRPPFNPLPRAVGFLGFAARYSSQSSQLRHPLLGPEYIVEQTGHIMAHIQLWPMQARISPETVAKRL